MRITITLYHTTNRFFIKPETNIAIYVKKNYIAHAYKIMGELSILVTTIFFVIVSTIGTAITEFFGALLGLWNAVWWLLISGFFWYFTNMMTWNNFFMPTYRKTNFWWVHLQIEVPDDNEASPKAMEAILLGIAGSHDTLDWQEQFWEAAYQPYYTLEVVSIEGNVKFIITTIEIFKENVKAQFYAHYPGAVIKEVDDYCQTFPDDFYNKGYDLFGGHMMLQKKDAWPIRTYEAWINKADNIFVDPMMTLVEFMGSLGKTEQAWLHISIMPMWNRVWSEKDCTDLMEEIVRNRLSAGISKGGPKVGMMKQSLQELVDYPRYFTQALVEDPETPNFGGKSEEARFVFQQLTPAEKDQIIAINKTAGEVGFMTRIRYFYGGKVDVASKPRGFSGMVGVFKQFADHSLNSFKPDLSRTATRAKFFFKKRRLLLRKRRILRWTKGRIWARGIHPFILTVSEIATIWHLPLAEAKTPLLRKVESKTEAPPTDLPIIPEGS